MRFTRKRVAILGVAAAVAAAVAVPVALATVLPGTLNAASDPQNTSGLRLVRSGVISTCANPKSNPGTIASGGNLAYDRYSFVNPAYKSQCVNVRLAHSCLYSGYDTNAFAQANTLFDPTDPSSNYLGDAGQSGGGIYYSSQNFSFWVSPLSSFDVTVGQVYPDAALNCSYKLTVNIGTVSKQTLSSAKPAAYDKR